MHIQLYAEIIKGFEQHIPIHCNLEQGPYDLENEDKDKKEKDIFHACSICFLFIIVKNSFIYCLVILSQV